MTDKPILRREARALRARIDGAAIAEWAESASCHFFGGLLANWHGGGRKPVIAGYWPRGSEFNVRPLMTYLHEYGHKVCLPVCEKDIRLMQFRVWTPQAVLEPDALGIDAPPLSAETVTPDIVIAPLLAFTMVGDRLGYGAGYYDATLADLRKSGSAIAVGYAYAEQEIPLIPIEPHDIPLDWIVTESFARAIT